MDISTKVIATFSPDRTDNLKGNAASFIGKRLRFDGRFLISEGPYEGQVAMWNRELGGWVPNSDLTDVTDE